MTKNVAAKSAKKKTSKKKPAQKKASAKNLNKKPKVKKKVGRPTAYTPELGDLICAKIAEGISLHSICVTNEQLPTARTVYTWLRNDQEFLQNYEHAKEDQADRMVEEMLDISDDGRNDYMEKLGAEGEINGVQLNSENIQRSRLRVETRKWAASKFKSKKYGDRTTTVHEGGIKMLTEMTEEELDKRQAEVEGEILKSKQD